MHARTLGTQQPGALALLQRLLSLAHKPSTRASTSASETDTGLEERRPGVDLAGAQSPQKAEPCPRPTGRFFSARRVIPAQQRTRHLNPDATGCCWCTLMCRAFQRRDLFPLLKATRVAADNLSNRTVGYYLDKQFGSQPIFLPCVSNNV